MESKFTGRLSGLIGMKLLCGLLNIISLFIAVPWTTCMMQKWETKHTILDGKQLTFDGNGGQLIGNYIKWILLTLITFGIYSFWLGIKLKQWTTKHTHVVAAVENAPVAENA